MSLDSATEYALSFSEDAVHLQRRERVAGDIAAPRPAWRHLGSVEFDSAAFRDEFDRLRGMASGGASGGQGMLPVTLIIPDDQILYTTLSVPPGADRERAVGRALDGLTPYPIDDLAFDWDGDGDTVRVAAVARQTLREARAFAAQYGFEGQGYCAAPPAETYPGEPAFVLEAAAQRPRPQGDPAQAGVTSATLMIEEEPAEAPVADAAGALDLDLGGDEAGDSAAAHAGVSPAVDEGVPVEADAPAGEESIGEEPAEPLATEPEAVEAEADEPAEKGAADAAGEEKPGEDAGTGPADEAPAVASVEPAPAEADAPSEPAPIEAETPETEVAADEAPGPEAASGSGPAALAGTGSQAPVLPAGAAGAAFGEGISQRKEPLVSRVNATGERPAAASQARRVDPGAAPARRPGERGGLMGLVAMLSALVVGLIVIWAFLVPGEPRPELAQAPESAAAVRPAAQESAPAETAQVEPVQVEPAPVETAAVEPAEVDAEALPAKPVPVVTAAPQAADPASALTEEERRRVLVAAAAVAAAVVPPPAATAVAVPADAPVSLAPVAATPIAPTRVATEPARSIAEAPAAPAPQPARPSAVAPAAPASPASAAAVAALDRSARPQLAPRRSTPQATVPSTEAAPRLPGNPPPYEASQRRPIGTARPPERRARVEQVQPVATPAAQPAALRGSARPPLRPEGSVPDLPDAGGDGAEALTAAESRQLDRLIRDMARQGPTAAAAPERLAELRPRRKPPQGGQASDAVSPSAVEAALRSAANAPPDRPVRSDNAAAPARDSGGLLRGSSRPRQRPGAGGASPGATDKAVEAAIASAVAATPGGVRLSALASSPLPPRRGADPAPTAAPAAAAPPLAPASPQAVAPRLPPATGPSEAEMTARRALDEQLQAQAEARIRARAQADARAEAQARAQAEARARAQAEAEERAARSRQQAYKPPEVDNEPEIAATALSRGTSSAGVAKAATETRAMDLGRTTIIGIIGAGKASRALIRLRNGKVVTVRLGDRIDGGTINSIGDGRLTYVKGGRTHELRLLDGR